MTPWKWNDEIKLWVNSVTDETMTAIEYDDARCKQIAQLEADLEERTKQFHLAEVKVMSREAIIEQLSETELAKDVTRLEGESEALHILRDVVDWSTKSHRERYQEGTMKCELCEAWDKYSGKIALLNETD